jgi:hypothetical protein
LQPVENGVRRQFSHPVFDSIRRWLDRLPTGSWPTLDCLNALAEESQVRTASGRPLRFVAPSAADPYYEVHLHETGCVATRAQNWHDLFNALVWLSYPRTKAAINALHAREIPREDGRRGRLRDLLTIFDEGGAIVVCDDVELQQLIVEFRWKELFWERRKQVVSSVRFFVLGHAVLEKALDPWPGVACKAMFVGSNEDPDASAARWLSEHATPRELAPLPVFGYPGWLPASATAEFYDDERYFRPLRREK